MIGFLCVSSLWHIILFGALSVECDGRHRLQMHWRLFIRHFCSARTSFNINIYHFFNTRYERHTHLSFNKKCGAQKQPRKIKTADDEYSFIAPFFCRTCSITQLANIRFKQNQHSFLEVYYTFPPLTRYYFLYCLLASVNIVWDDANQYLLLLSLLSKNVCSNQSRIGCVRRIFSPIFFVRHTNNTYIANANNTRVSYVTI